jgi:hypothetical protein
MANFEQNWAELEAITEAWMRDEKKTDKQLSEFLLSHVFDKKAVSAAQEQHTEVLAQHNCLRHQVPHPDQREFFGSVCQLCWPHNCERFARRISADGFWVCSFCSRVLDQHAVFEEGAFIDSKRTQTIGYYKPVHYVASQLRAYNLGNTPPHPSIVQVLAGNWQAQGRPRLDKDTIHRLLDTRTRSCGCPTRCRPWCYTYKKRRAASRNWRQLIFLLEGRKPDAISERLESRVLRLFLRLHLTWPKHRESGKTPKGRNRSNVSYRLQLRDLFKLCCLDTCLDWLPVPKTPNVYTRYYSVWEKLCRDQQFPLIWNVPWRNVSIDASGLGGSA